MSITVKATDSAGGANSTAVKLTLK
jgi:hypothetical protein